MAKSSAKIKEISDELNEHIIAVRGTLELASASLSNGEELNKLLLKATERMDAIQKLSNEMFAALHQIIDKIDDMKNIKTDTDK